MPYSQLLEFEAVQGWLFGRTLERAKAAGEDGAVRGGRKDAGPHGPLYLVSKRENISQQALSP